jgi:hypothetical protein
MPFTEDVSIAAMIVPAGLVFPARPVSNAIILDPAVGVPNISPPDEVP